MAITMRQQVRNLSRFFTERNMDVSIVNSKRGSIVDFFDLKLGPKVRFKTVANLAIEIGLKLKSIKTPMVQPMGEKGIVRVEAARAERRLVRFDKKLSSYPLNIHLGVSCTNDKVVLNIIDCPHLLVAGSTYSGKSVVLHNIITAGLLQHKYVNTHLIDPKQVEFNIYKNILPVYTDAKSATRLLKYFIRTMKGKLDLLEASGARNIAEYNQLQVEPMKYDLVIIDELADLMGDQEFESALAELSQKSRSVGIHLVVATQRPSVDIINGVIKANFPARIACRVPTFTDSRVILNCTGAENLIGKGDALLLSPGNSSTIRFQGAYQSASDIKNIISTIKTSQINNKIGAQTINKNGLVHTPMRVARMIRNDLSGRGYLKGSSIDITQCYPFLYWRNLPSQSSDYLSIIGALTRAGVLEIAGEIDGHNYAGIPGIKHRYIVHLENIDG